MKSHIPWPLTLFLRHFQKGKFGLFGHKRSKSETEASDSYICPVDLALPLDRLKISALQYQDKEVGSWGGDYK